MISAHMLYIQQEIKRRENHCISEINRIKYWINRNLELPDSKLKTHTIARLSQEMESWEIKLKKCQRGIF